MLDDMRGYLQGASGLTDLPRKRAQELAASLIAAGSTGPTGAVASQVSTLAEDLINVAKANRDAIREMIRGEVEVAVARLGLVPASELAAAQRKIARLEATVAELKRSGAGGSAAKASSSRPKRATVKRAAASAPSAASTKAPARRRRARRPRARRSPPRTASVRRT